MKKLMIITNDIKAIMSMFSISILMTYGFVSLFTGNESMPLGVFWQSLLLGILIGGLQFIMYNKKFFKGISNNARVVIHYIIIFILLISFIRIFNWVELWKIKEWMFIAIYTVFFIQVCVAFAIYTKATGERFNERLISYKEKNDIKE